MPGGFCISRGPVPDAARAAGAWPQGEPHMSTDAQQPNPLMKKRIVCTMPDVDTITVRRNHEYPATAGPLPMDLYYPRDARDGAPRPAVVIVGGYAGSFKEMGWTASWAELIAASGMVAIAYTNRQPAADAVAVLRYVQRERAALGV